MRNNEFGLFHAVIIALAVCICLSGCGYKGNPQYIAQSGKQAANGEKVTIAFLSDFGSDTKALL